MLGGWGPPYILFLHRKVSLSLFSLISLSLSFLSLSLPQARTMFSLIFCFLLSLHSFSRFFHSHLPPQSAPAGLYQWVETRVLLSLLLFVISNALSLSLLSLPSRPLLLLPLILFDILFCLWLSRYREGFVCALTGTQRRGLAEKTILITGGNSGIGKEVALNVCFASISFTHTHTLSLSLPLLLFSLIFYFLSLSLLFSLFSHNSTFFVFLN